MTRLLTVDDVAERLGVTKDCGVGTARAGRIPHVQLGRYRRFGEEALEKWLDEPEVQRVERLAARRRKAKWASMSSGAHWSSGGNGWRGSGPPR